MLVKIILLSALFPYVGPISGFDTQPVYAVLTVMLFVLSKRCDVLPLLVAALSISLTLSFAVTYSSAPLGSLATYLVASVTLAFSCAFGGRLQSHLSLRLLHYAALIYAVIAIAQLAVDPTLFSALVSRSSESSLELASTGRGARSLTGEPQQLGLIFTYLYLFTIYNMRIDAFYRGLTSIRSDKFFTATAVYFFMVLFLSQSAYSVFVFVVVLLLLLLALRKFSLIFGASFVLMVVVGAALQFLPVDSRFWTVASLFFSSPEELQQFGAYGRAMNVPISLAGIWQCFPSGISECSVQNPMNVWSPFGSFQHTLMTRAWGGLLEVVLVLGIGGLHLLGVVAIMLFRALRGPFALLVLPLGFLMIQDGSVAYPPSLLLLSFISYGSKQSILEAKQRHYRTLAADGGFAGAAKNHVETECPGNG